MGILKINKTKYIIAFIIFLLWSHNNITLAQDNNELINLYLNAEYQIKQNKIKHPFEINPKLKKFSLYPYLEYTLIKRNLDFKDRYKVLKFYQKYKDSPVTKALNFYWINHLYKHKKWELILQDYKENKSTLLKCMYVYAMQQVSPDKINKKVIEDLWVYGKSRPKICNPLFDLWLEKNDTNKAVLTDELIQKRIEKALESRNLSLARYLNKKLSNSNQYKQDNLLYIKIHNNPYLIQKNKLFNVNNKYHKKIILNGIKKMYYKNPHKALELLNNLNKKYKFNKKNYNFVKNLIAIRLYQNQAELAEKIYNQIPYKYKSNDLITISIRNSISKNNWENVSVKIENMSDELKNQDTWQYWLAKAYEKNNDLLDCKLIMAKLAKKNNYYGLLAQDYLDITPKLKIYDSNIYKNKINNLENNPNFQRALDFYKLNQYYLARKEWNYASHKIDKNDLIFAAMLAEKYNWHDRAIITLTIIGKNKGLDPDNINNLLFPLANQKIVNYEADNQNLDPALIYAVTKKESHFMHDVGSYKGAQGLMQLMPRTAKGIAKKLKDRFDRNNLKEAKTNIKYGSFYLREMLNMYGNNLVLAAAAYNAGPTNVKRWLEKYNNMPADAWIEMVPYRETRNYIKNVMSYTAIYQMMLNQRCDMSDLIKDIKQ